VNIGTPRRPLRSEIARKAAVVTQLGAAPQILDIPLPRPGPGQVLARIVFQV
jgi:hypothetical protein